MPSPNADARGTVVAFEEHRGIGTVEDATGRRYDFHCTAIEGSRTIDVATPVLFSLVPGRLGRYEAAAVRSATTEPEP